MTKILNEGEEIIITPDPGAAIEAEVSKACSLAFRIGQGINELFPQVDIKSVVLRWDKVNDIRIPVDATKTPNQLMDECQTMVDKILNKTPEKELLENFIRHGGQIALGEITLGKGHRRNAILQSHAGKFRIIFDQDYILSNRCFTVLSKFFVKGINGGDYEGEDTYFFLDIKSALDAFKKCEKYFQENPDMEYFEENPAEKITEDPE